MGCEKGREERNGGGREGQAIKTYLARRGDKAAEEALHPAAAAAATAAAAEACAVDVAREGGFLECDEHQ